MTTDAPVPAEVLNAIAGAEDFLDARAVSL